MEINRPLHTDNFVSIQGHIIIIYLLLSFLGTQDILNCLLPFFGTEKALVGSRPSKQDIRLWFSSHIPDLRLFSLTIYSRLRKGH